MSRPKNIKIFVSGLNHNHRLITDCFYDCLADYCERFEVLPTEGPVKIYVNLISANDDDDTHGSVIHSLGDRTKYLVQVQDPFLRGSGFDTFTTARFIECLCHEFVHVCQYLTDRDKVRYTYPTIYGDEREKYFFSNIEIEARLLAAPYSEFYG